MSYRSIGLSMMAVTFVSLSGALDQHALGQEDPSVVEVRSVSDKLMAAFNGGKADEVVGMFLANGELIDDAGLVYQGQHEIKELVTAFLTKFPGSHMKSDPQSIRIFGPTAIQEGRRITTATDGGIAVNRYICVLSKTDQGWRIASLRDFSDEPAPTPGDLLKPLEWLVGDWINEGADARVKIAYRWSEDNNYILGDISVMKDEQVVMKSSQRIGWDALHGTPRSWTFDSDGGFAEATWNQVDDSWVVRSSATLPDGQTGSALLKISNGQNGRYVMSGSNRIIGNVMEDDYQITVVKQPPAAGK